MLKRLVFITISLFAVMALFGSATQAEAKAKAESINPKQCYECHDTVSSLHTSGAHKDVSCTSCHSGLTEHLKDSAKRPQVDTSWQACGQCHTEQHGSFLKVNDERIVRDEKSQLTGRSPNPFWDKLIMGHGFTKEHALGRSHPYMLLDQVLVDRSFGGRFQPKNGWQYVNDKPGKLWDTIVDTQPDTNAHKAFNTQTAAAVNPVCFQCKTQDHILDWAYLGDPKTDAPFSRKSNPVDVIRSGKVQHGLNCFTCHDPHSAKPRIVRDGLIAALTRAEADTLWHKDPNRTKIEVIDMGMRGYTRKIAILEKYDSRLQCGQCHVEYVCNPGSIRDTGEKVTFDSELTNHFPFKDVFGMYDHYVNQIKFTDYVHPLTGAKLIKFQHPEAESSYNSKHAKAGVNCDTCHTPKMKDPKTGKEYTSHFAVSPAHHLKESCLSGGCHVGWTEVDAERSIKSVKAHIKGKLRKSEFWLDRLIDKIVEAKKAGVAAEVIAKAQDEHVKAHFLWEWWTAENSDGFHNPDMAKEAIGQSISASMRGVKLMDEAMAGVAKK